MMRDYLKELNPAQREAVLHYNGPSLILAGAGSGKTRVLTYRIVHLLHEGIEPHNILALTFTNKAANEMKERIQRMVGEKARYLWMGTFHSIFARILRAESVRIGYPANFTIYDPDDSRGLVKSIIKELSLDEKIYAPNVIYSRISLLKNNLISPEEYRDDKNFQEKDRYSRRTETWRIYALYNNRLHLSAAMDFDDLLFKTYVLMHEFPDVLLKYQDRFRYILVDEYQDTNHAQYLIIKKLAKKYENICVVGDDSQSIYSFRGADISNILNFKHDFPDYAMFKLEQNYRSTANIVEGANSLIEHNQNRLPKKIYTSNERGEKITVHCCGTDIEEGEYVASRIFEEMQRQHCSYSDIAVLYRTNAQSRIIEEALRKKNIHYKIYGGISFYQRKEIKDILAYFRLCVNPSDEEALKRVINYPARGIGEATLNKLLSVALENKTSVWSILENIQQYPLNIHTGTINKLVEFRDMIKSFGIQLYQKSAYEMAEIILKQTGLYYDLNQDKTPEGISRYENIMELLNGVKEFTQRESTNENIPTLEDYLQEISLLTDLDDKNKQERNAVSLMTIHMSKGLEFNYVFVVGLEEGLFPHYNIIDNPKSLEEERRLLYVAITRARKKCTLSYAMNRYRNGQTHPSSPSSFIAEINADYIEYSGLAETYRSSHNISSIRRKSSFYINSLLSTYLSTPPTSSNPGSYSPAKLVNISDASLPTTSALSLNLMVGDWVMHEKFGAGEITKLEGKFPDIKATIAFSEAGRKVILLKYARLSKLNK